MPSEILQEHHQAEKFEGPQNWILLLKVPEKLQSHLTIKLVILFVVEKIVDSHKCDRNLGKS